MCNFQDFDDSKLKEKNFPPTPDDLTTQAVLVGNKSCQLWFGHFGGMPLKYQKAVLSSGPWVDGDTDLNASSVYPPAGSIRKVGISDFSGASPYRYLRCVISPATAVAAGQNYGTGRVSNLFLQLVTDL